MDEQRRPAGRPRDPSLDEAALQAAWELLEALGYHGVTMAGVAARAGMHKPAIYRRWPTKPLLVIDALESYLPRVTMGDTGSLEGDLRQGAVELSEVWGLPHIYAGFAALMGDLAHDPDAEAAYRLKIAGPRSHALAAAVRRAIDRGEVPETTQHSTIADLLEGPLMHCALAGRRPSADLIDEIVAGALAAATRA